MAARLQAIDNARRYLALFDFRGSIAAAEVGQRNRLLDIELPVQDSDDRLGNVVDDHRSSGRAQGGDQLMGLPVEDQGRGHR